MAAGELLSPTRSNTSEPGGMAPPGTLAASAAVGCALAGALRVYDGEAADACTVGDGCTLIASNGGGVMPWKNAL